MVKRPTDDELEAVERAERFLAGITANIHKGFYTTTKPCPAARATLSTLRALSAERDAAQELLDKAKDWMQRADDDRLAEKARAKAAEAALEAEKASHKITLDRGAAAYARHDARADLASTSDEWVKRLMEAAIACHPYVEELRCGEELREAVQALRDIEG